MGRIEIDIFPQIGAVPIATITHQHMIAALRKTEARGAHEVAHCVKATLREDFQLCQLVRLTEVEPGSRFK